MADNYQIAPGWYPDPSGYHQLRYYDSAWTDHVSNSGAVSSSPLHDPGLATTKLTPPAAFVSPPHPGAQYSPYGVAGPTIAGAGLAGASTPNVRVRSRSAVLVLIGGLLMALGPLFAWETASSAVLGGVVSSVKGTSEGAGPVVLTAGLVSALLAGLVLTGYIGLRKAGVATLVMSVLSVVFCFGNAVAISNDIDDASSDISASIGIGLIFAIVGCVLTAIASTGLLRRRR